MPEHAVPWPNASSCEPRISTTPPFSSSVIATPLSVSTQPPRSGWSASTPLSMIATRTPRPVAPPHAHSGVRSLEARRSGQAHRDGVPAVRGAVFVSHWRSARRSVTRRLRSDWDRWPRAGAVRRRARRARARVCATLRAVSTAMPATPAMSVASSTSSKLNIAWSALSTISRTPATPSSDSHGMHRTLRGRRPMIAATPSRGARVVGARRERHRLTRAEHETRGAGVGVDDGAEHVGRVRARGGDDFERGSAPDEEPAVGAARAGDRGFDECLEDGLGHVRS